MFQLDGRTFHCRVLWENRREITKRRGKRGKYPKPVVSYSNVQNGYDGTGNIDTDPGFVNPRKEYFRLGKDSPCINAGNNDAANLPQTDLAGKPRINDLIVDMGAYEYQNKPVSGDDKDK